MQKCKGFLILASLVLCLMMVLSGVSVVYGRGTLIILIKYESLSNTALFALVSREHVECNLAEGFDPDNLEDFHRSWVLLRSKQKNSI
jgi:hypothetical protein